MQQIDFHFNVAQRTIYASRLIKKARKMGLTVAVWSSNEVLLRRAYDDLWRFEDLTFIAHAWAGSAFEADAPVIFASDFLTTRCRPTGSIRWRRLTVLLTSSPPIRRNFSIPAPAIGCTKPPA